jgi:TonB-dependent SusC/RagA subfamily outer membrane receptor
MKYRILFIFLLSALLSSFALGQKANPVSKKKLTISGLVTDVNQKPVEGAIILIDKKTINCSTNSKGFYKLKVRPDAQLITVFTINNSLNEERIEGRTTINFTLSEQTASQKTNPSESVPGETVNVGYGSVDKKNLTTQVNSLNMGNMKNQSYSDIYEMLAGKIPGVQVNGKSIRIQGASSFMLSTEPLFVVDGVIVPSIEFVSPSEVNSIEVLKGASAGIYGSRGANGVILIRLKGASDKK